MVYVSERFRLPAFAPFQGVTGRYLDIVCHKEVENRISVLGHPRLPPHPPSQNAMSQHFDIECLKDVTNATPVLSLFRLLLRSSSDGATRQPFDNVSLEVENKTIVLELSTSSSIAVSRRYLTTFGFRMPLPGEQQDVRARTILGLKAPPDIISISSA